MKNAKAAWRVGILCVLKSCLLHTPFPASRLCVLLEIITLVPILWKLINVWQNFDQSLLIIRRRLGWPVRQILFLSLNHFRHLTPADWPPAIRAAMNATLAPDWDFHARARALWREQVRAYGERRLQRDADGFRELRRLLVEACGGEQLEERGRREFVTACVFNSQQPDCARQRQALMCMLQVYDTCLTGSRVHFISFRIKPGVDCPRMAKQEAELDADLEEEPEMNIK